MIRTDQPVFFNPDAMPLMLSSTVATSSSSGSAVSRRRFSG